MRFLATLLVLALPGLSDAQPEPVDPGDLFPVSIGLTWAYKGPFDDERLIRIIETTSTDNEVALVLSGLMGDRVIRKVDGRVEQFSSGSWRLLFDLTAQADESWTIDMESVGSDFLDGATVRVIDRAAQLEVPFGRFEEVTHLLVTPPPGLADAGLTELWLAPGVGIIAWAEQSIAGPRTYLLVSFSNRFEPAPVPVEVSLNVDRSAYTPSDSVVVDYALKNVSADTIRLAFTGGQRYDLALTNSQSEERIWIWSMDKLFISSIGEILISPGATYTFSEVIQLSAIKMGADGVRVLQVHLSVSDDASDVRLEDTRAAKRLWVGASSLAEEPSNPPDREDTSSVIARKSDFDNSGAVDFGDFISFAIAFGTRAGDVAFEPVFDLDEDGQVGFGDFLAFASTFGARIVSP